jgi:hypothetical protein
MARPLKVANTYDLQQMTDTEIDNKIVPLILQEYASKGGATNTRGVLSLQNDALGPQGTVVDNFRGDDVGVHPVDPNNYTGNSTSVYVNTSTMSTTSVPPILKGTATNLQAMTDAEIITNILDRTVTEYIKTSSPDYPVSTYYMSTAAPSDGGTWANRYSFADRYRASGTDVTTTYNLYQKTGPTADTSSYAKLVKSVNGNTVQEMTDTEIKTLYTHFANLLIGSHGTYGNVGEYKVVTGSTAPGTGTWTQVGGFTDSLTDVTSVYYSAGYTGTYSAGYAGNYSSGFAGTYSAAFSAGYAGIYSRGLAYYSAGYARSGGYAGTYSAGYTGNYAGVYDLLYGVTLGGTFYGTVGGSFTGYYAGTYSRGFAGTYSRAVGHYSAGYLRSGGFAGTYSSPFSAGYTGNYSTGYTGTYSAGYTGNYSTGFAGGTVQSAVTTTTYTFWKRLSG